MDHTVFHKCLIKQTTLNEDRGEGRVKALSLLSYILKYISLVECRNRKKKKTLFFLSKKLTT